MDTTAGRAREHDIDWRHAVERVAWVPARYRQADLPASAARRALRCTEASFAQLVDLGLPWAEGPDEPLYDRHDVQNAGLLSGTGLTDVESGMRLVLAFMHAAPEDLVRPRRWRYELHLKSEAEVGARLLRRLYRPMPEVTGGVLESCTVAGGRPLEVSGPFVAVPEGSTVTGTLVTCGIDQQVRSDAIRKVTAELLDSGIRWQYLPEGLAADPAEALALGVGNCGTLCALLAGRLLEEGFEASCYRGWMIALSQMGHGWVEVVDEDGVVKWLDPSFALLATANGFGTTAFRDFVLGAAVNRVVPTRAPLGGSFRVDGDDGDGGDGEDPVAFTCRADGGPVGATPKRRGPLRRTRPEQ